MANYLGGTRLLYRVLGVSIGIPVQQGDVAEGIKTPSMVTI
ncbi:phenylalanine ammonia-lyase [Puccinia sorghi]|uniref:Phenylalanine ammonia-lyase n=1 Tax=Puccinia sorghi TaxID=27349 RepID=A0A0L6VE56_9BASI|nr:phenylalanine ammonia-lyase [Puccinia sorghi]